MARGLLCRILDFMLQQGWLKRGDTVLDPFSGVGTTAIEAASRGIRAVGVELEERFHLLGLANMELHRRTWATFGDPHPVLLRGDSRRLPAEAAMTEAEWLASDDPTAMLEAITKRDMPRGGTISDRKLRLFTEACRADASSPPTAAQAAALLRDICGNPYRPVAIPCTRQAFVGDWLTPTVVGIARRACGEQQCPTCGGKGGFLPYEPGLLNESCSTCQGKGTVLGPFFPEALPVLADALEDAGCDNEDVLRHCRGEEICWECCGDGVWQANSTMVPCGWCDEKLDQHRPLRGPHVRGCWVVDLLLGKD